MTIISTYTAIARPDGKLRRHGRASENADRCGKASQWSAKSLSRHYDLSSLLRIENGLTDFVDAVNFIKQSCKRTPGTDHPSLNFTLLWSCFVYAATWEALPSTTNALQSLWHAAQPSCRCFRREANSTISKASSHSSSTYSYSTSQALPRSPTQHLSPPDVPFTNIRCYYGWKWISEGLRSERANYTEGLIIALLTDHSAGSISCLWTRKALKYMSWIMHCRPLTHFKRR